jgi:hypothetical protein
MVSGKVGLRELNRERALHVNDGRAGLNAPRQ